MTTVYINSPTALFSVAQVPLSRRRWRNLPDQRTVRLNRENLNAFVTDCQLGRHHFTAQAGLNDMWIELDLGDLRAEDEALHQIQQALGTHFKRIRNAKWTYPRTV